MMQLLAGLGPLGVPELLIIAFIVVLVFGVGRLPEVGGAVGRGIREFRKATKDGNDESGDTTAHTSAQPSADASAPPADVPAGSPSDSVFCSECGAKNIGGAKFCAECGKPIAAPVS